MDATARLVHLHCRCLLKLLRMTYSTTCCKAAPLLCICRKATACRPPAPTALPQLQLLCADSQLQPSKAAVWSPCHSALLPDAADKDASQAAAGKQAAHLAQRLAIDLLRHALVVEGAPAIKQILTGVSGAVQARQEAGAHHASQCSTHSLESSSISSFFWQPVLG